VIVTLKKNSNHKQNLRLSKMNKRRSFLLRIQIEMGLAIYSCLLRCRPKRLKQTFGPHRQKSINPVASLQSYDFKVSVHSSMNGQG
jgi:hypothetical protein